MFSKNKNTTIKAGHYPHIIITIIIIIILVILIVVLIIF